MKKPKYQKDIERAMKSTQKINEEFKKLAKKIAKDSKKWYP